MNPKSSMGSMISIKQRDRVHDIISRSSAKVLIGGYKLEGLSRLDGFNLSNGAFYPPTVVTECDLNEEIWQEEIFGPVVVLQKFRVVYPFPL